MEIRAQGIEPEQDVAVASDAPTEVVWYQRGLPFRSVLRGTVLRFVPGAAIASALGIAVGPSEPGLLSGDGIAMVAGLVTFLAAGFGLGLESLRRWLYPDAEVEGRRSFIAGLMSPLAFFSAGVVAGPIPEEQFLALMALPGLALAVLMYFAWLPPTPQNRLVLGSRSEAE